MRVPEGRKNIQGPDLAETQQGMTGVCKAPATSAVVVYDNFARLH